MSSSHQSYCKNIKSLFIAKVLDLHTTDFMCFPSDNESVYEFQFSMSIGFIPTHQSITRLPCWVDHIRSYANVGMYNMCVNPSTYSTCQYLYCYHNRNPCCQAYDILSSHIILTVSRHTDDKF